MRADVPEMSGCEAATADVDGPGELHCSGFCRLYYHGEGRADDAEVGAEIHEDGNETSGEKSKKS